MFTWWNEAGHIGNNVCADFNSCALNQFFPELCVGDGAPS